MNGNSRSIIVKKNIIASFFLKCISILVSLQVVPLTITYINPTKYGIWLTLSSIIAWLSYFDLGFAHGFRNRFSEAKANGNILLAKEYVSTTYAVLSVLFLSVFFIAVIINHFLDWSSILNVATIYRSELHDVFNILTVFFCVNIVASIFTTMLTADQKPALASLIQTIGQVLAFICIYVFTKKFSGSLILLAFAFSGVPCILLVLVSIVMFRYEKYKSVSPAFRFIRFSLIKNILGLGGQFFFIMLSILFIFQFTNIIITRIEGPDVVTQYNIAYKYFNVLNMFALIILSPFWSAFTDAYVKKDFYWMKNMLRKYLGDSMSIMQIIGKIRPTEVYNLAAQSHVQVSFDAPEFTADVDATGVLRVLEAIRQSGLTETCKVYQASTSELYGKVEEVPQNENTPFHPYSPYAVAKLYGYWIVKEYREAYNMFCCSGILFNHESERRGETFVTRKITLAAARIAQGKQDKLYLGNLSSLRDWGYAKDYVECMWLILQNKTPEDFVIATGEQHSVREFCQLAFHYAGIELEFRGEGLEEKGIDKATGRVLVEVSEDFYRPTDVVNLWGDPTKARKELGWNPMKTSFEELVSIMMKHDMEKVAVERVAGHIRTNLAEYLEKGIVK